MFRIDKQLVLQHNQPADIPLIPVPLPDSAREEPGTLEEKVAAANVEAANSNAHSEALTQEAQKKAKQIVQNAEKQAAQLLQQAEEQARQQAEAIRADAWQSGLEEGRNEALREARAEQEEWNFSAQQQLQSSLAQISAGREEMFALMEGDIIDLALACAGKITHHIAAQDSGALTAMMQQALRQMRRENKITIQVSEEQYAAFFQAESANFVLGDETLNIAIVGNPELQAGDLLLESEDETVNAGIDSQLKHITLAFGRPWEPGL